LNYIKLNPFLNSEFDKEDFNSPQSKITQNPHNVLPNKNSPQKTSLNNNQSNLESPDERFEKNMELSAYVNTDVMLE
jgi:hypothetical protein